MSGKKRYALKSFCEDEGSVLSQHDYSKWTPNRWRKTTKPVIPCENGFHYLTPNGLYEWGGWGDTLGLVELGGSVIVIHEEDEPGEKAATNRMRLVRVIPLTREFLADWAADNNPHISPEQVSYILRYLRYSWSPTYVIESALYVPSFYGDYQPGAKRAETMRLSRLLYNAIMAEYVPEIGG